MADNEKDGHDKHTARIGRKFYDEMENIQTVRQQIGIDKKKTSIKKITNLIIRHKSWPLIRQDLMKVVIKGDKING